MAPEIFQGQIQTFKVDIWALGKFIFCIDFKIKIIIKFILINSGILLYEIFHKKPPYETRDMGKLNNMIHRNALKIRSDVDPRVANLIKKLLNKNPLQRPSCKEILLDKNLRELSNQNQILINQSIRNKNHK
jgi:serine/threonine protein kinase